MRDREFNGNRNEETNEEPLWSYSRVVVSVSGSAVVHKRIRSRCDIITLSPLCQSAGTGVPAFALGSSATVGAGAHGEPGAR